MIRKTLTLTLVILSIFLFLPKTHAQVATNYYFAHAIGGYSPISGGTIVATASGIAPLDTGSFTVPLPFTFTFNGIAYTSCKATANGYITFGSIPAPSTENAPISSTGGFEGAISAMGTNLWGLYVSKGSCTVGSPTLTGISSLYGLKIGSMINSPYVTPGTTAIAIDSITKTITMSANALSTATNDFIAWPTGEISTTTLGVAPNRVFVIQYKDMGDYSTTPGAGGGINFQIRLEEGNAMPMRQKVKIIYGPSSYLLTTPINNQVGIRGNSNTDFLNRQSTTSWINTVAGTLNTDNIQRTNTLYPQSRIYTFSPNSKPIANFSVNFNGSVPSQPITCTDMSQEIPTRWKWYLVNTTSTPPVHPGAFFPSDTVQSPTLTVGQIGVWNLCLIASNALGSDTFCKPNSIQIIPEYPICAGQSMKQDTLADDLKGSCRLFTISGNYLPALIGTCGKGFTVATCADTVELFINVFRMRENVVGTQADSLIIHQGTKTGPVIARLGGTVLPSIYDTIRVAGGKFFLETKLANTFGLNGDSGYTISWKALPSSALLSIGHISSSSASISVVTNSTQTVNLMAKSSSFNAQQVFFSEIAHERSSSGQPVGGWPTYLQADDYIELTGYPYADIAGFTLQEWTGSAMQHSVTFPGGTIFSPNGTMILATGQLGTSVSSPLNYYYHTGNTISHNATTDLRGYILKNPSGVIVDAVVYGAYSFPVASGITSTFWSGTTAAVSGSGNRLNAPDNNTSSTWINSGSTPQDPNVLNAGVSYPVLTSAPGFNWLYTGTSISNSPFTTVGPFTTPGVYKYVASYGCGTFNDTIVITASAMVPVKLIRFNGTKENADVILNWKTATEINSNRFSIERSFDGKKYDAIGTVKAAGNSSRVLNYSKKDEKIIETVWGSPAINQLYYRLKMIDNDGSYEYSNIVVITPDKIETKAFSVVPNPFNDHVDLHIYATHDASAAIDIIDITGKTILSYIQDVKQGNAAYHLQQPELLKPGVYFVNIELNGKRQVAKLLKQ